jgi:hypothetical protein
MPGRRQLRWMYDVMLTESARAAGHERGDHGRAPFASFNQKPGLARNCAWSSAWAVNPEALPRRRRSWA